MTEAQISTYYDKENKINRDKAQLIVLGLIQDKPGISTIQISDRLGKPMNTFSGRLTDLQEAGLILPMEGKHKAGKRTYTRWKYVEGSVAQAKARADYHSKIFVKNASNLIDRFALELGPEAIRYLQSRMELFKSQ